MQTQAVNSRLHVVSATLCRVTSAAVAQWPLSLSAFQRAKSTRFSKARQAEVLPVQCEVGRLTFGSRRAGGKLLAMRRSAISSCRSVSSCRPPLFKAGAYQAGRAIVHHSAGYRLPNPAFNLTYNSAPLPASKAAIAHHALAARSVTLLHAG